MNPKASGGSGTNNRTPSRVESENEDMDASDMSEEEDENEEAGDEPTQEGDSSDEDHDMEEEDSSGEFTAELILNIPVDLFLSSY